MEGNVWGGWRQAVAVEAWTAIFGGWGGRCWPTVPCIAAAADSRFNIPQPAVATRILNSQSNNKIIND